VNHFERPHAIADRLASNITNNILVLVFFAAPAQTNFLVAFAGDRC